MIEKEYSDIAMEIETKVESGNMRLEYLCTDGQLVAKRFQVNRVVAEGSYVKLLNLKQVNDAISMANNAIDNYVDGLAYYLSETKLLGDKPGIDIRFPSAENDVFAPKLAGLLEDDCVIVNIIESIGKKFKIYGTAEFMIGRREQSFCYTRPERTEPKRDYSIGECLMHDRSIFHVHRHPVILCHGMDDKMERFAGLSYNILCQRLEPFTTEHIIRSADACGDNLTFQRFDEIKMDCLFEERFLAKTIVKDWLISSKYKSKFSGGDILSWRADGDLLSKNEYMALKEARFAGPEVIVDFYRSDNWDFLKLVNGSFY